MSQSHSVAGWRIYWETLHPAIFWEMVKFVDLDVLYFSLVLATEPTTGSLRASVDFEALGGFVHLARTSIISSLNPNESSPGRAGKALEKRETERVSGSGWRAAHTRRAGGRVSQSRKGLRS